MLCYHIPSPTIPLIFQRNCYFKLIDCIGISDIDSNNNNNNNNFILYLWISSLQFNIIVKFLVGFDIQELTSKFELDHIFSFC